ncbi:exported protein [Haemophilus influenzae]|uniref:Exported protein n=1 Tax=Haemophilus influenzae TaxID=727 RepID=A0A2X1PVJ2_HAEIF|nr:exported protein [Haemophilus influenzae]
MIGRKNITSTQNKVNRKLITLNHDNGAWLQYADGKMPAAFQIQQDGQWQQIVY